MRSRAFRPHNISCLCPPEPLRVSPSPDHPCIEMKVHVGTAALGWSAGRSPANSTTRAAPARRRFPLRRIHIPLLIIALVLPAAAGTVGSIRGIIHDPQHRPVQNAMVMLKAKTSDWSATTNSDANGEFTFTAVPLGEYSVTVAGIGFAQVQQDVMVLSSSQPVLHFALNVAAAKESINVSAA